MENIKNKFKALPTSDKVFYVFAILFVIDCILPDPLPFIDEILFGGGTGVSWYIRQFMKKKAKEKLSSTKYAEQASQIVDVVSSDRDSAAKIIKATASNTARTMVKAQVSKISQEQGDKEITSFDDKE